MTDIAVSDTNKVFSRDASDFTLESLRELVDSIREKGLVQPVLLRPDPKKPGKFILVAGERRYHASKFVHAENKDRAAIPAYIRHLSEDEAFDLQLTENIQRKDVHPMREARAYKFLQETKGWSTAELAKRFGKSESYVLQRLKLNALIPEAEKDFMSNAMSLSHALAVARLEAADQKEVVKGCSSKHGGKVYYDSVSQLEDYIQDNIVMDLKEASFDITDDKLVPKVGSCVKCPKRSGANALLFPDIKEKDRCFDGSCYKIKKSIALFATVKDLVDKTPDAFFVALKGNNGWNGVEAVPNNISSFLSGQKIKVLDDFTEYEAGYAGYKKKISAFMLNGNKAGKMVHVWIKGPAAAKGSSTAAASSAPSEMTAADRKEAIERIRERSKRAAELDNEKVYGRMMELLQTSKGWHEKTNATRTKAERALLAHLLYNHADFTTRREIAKELGVSDGYGSNAQKWVDRFKALTDGDLFWMVRQLAIGMHKDPAQERTSEGLLITEIAKMFGVPVDDLIKEQAEIRLKREARAKERIAALKTPGKKKGGKDGKK